jgi:hypothetical protein
LRDVSRKYVTGYSYFANVLLYKFIWWDALTNVGESNYSLSDA